MILKMEVSRVLDNKLTLALSSIVATLSQLGEVNMEVTPVP